MKNIVAVAVFLCLTFMSCTQEKFIEYEVFTGESKIVTHGYISTEDGVSVYLRKTVAPDAPDADDALSAAQATLYEDDSMVAELVENEEGLFTTDYSPQRGKNYKLEVKAEGVPDVKSDVQTLFQVVEIDSAWVNIDPQFSRYTVSLSFQDPPEAGNTYYIEIEKYFEDGTQYIEENTTASLFLDPFSTFTDEAENGRFITKVTGTNVYFYSEEDETSYLFDKLKVSLYTFSEDLGKYVESVDKYELNNNDPWIEPEPVYSNMENGFGIFGSYAKSTTWLEL